MKKLISIILSIVMIISIIPLNIVTNATTNEFAGGSGTEADPYLISTKTHLNNVRNHLDAHFKMIADIEFTDADFKEGGDFYNNGQGWAPIGENSTSAFTGVFDANNHSIFGLQITASTDTDLYVGLFGHCQGAICNLKLVDVTISGTITGDENNVYVGGISGYLLSNSIKNCSVSGLISAEESCSADIDKSKAFAGGIAGKAELASIISCSNYTNVTSKSNSKDTTEGGGTWYTYASAGGIVAETTGEISSSYNTGAIIASANGKYSFSFAGGITADSDSNILNCNNSGNVQAIGNPNNDAGGIASYFSNGKISECYNIGHITSDGDSGGIVAYNTGYSIEKSFNTGIITSQNQAGGITGYNTSEIICCYNTGDVYALSSNFGKAGGIVGHNEENVIKDCYNIGNISSEYLSGGIASYTNAGSIVQCYNSGMIISNSTAGGISGYNKGTIEQSSNTNKISSNGYGGGITGSNKGTVVKCFNSGTVTQSITSSNVSYATTSGGITGDNYGVIENCYNIGIVSAEYRIGGIAGHNYKGEIKNCYNIGEATALPSFSSFLGGIAGYTDRGTILNCYYIDKNPNGIGNNVDDVSIKCTDEELKKQETYVGFDFDKTWNTPTNDYKYPTLKYNNILLDTGVCGDSIIWELLRDNTLIISGTGKMYDNVTWPDKTSFKNVIIQNGVTSIGDGTFSYCNNLEIIVIPLSIESIGVWAFGSCSNLLSINIPDGVKIIEEGAFTQCTNLKTIKLPNSLVEISDGLFLDCLNLETINIPKTVTSIGSQAFAATAIKTIMLPNTINHLGSSAFQLCTELENIALPNGICTIPSNLFSFTEKLKTVILPNTVKNIDNWSFYMCTGLESIIIPINVERIGDEAFANCNSLSSITFDGEAPNIDSVAFSGVSATVYFSSCDSSWINEKKNNYGGNLEWKSYFIQHQYTSKIIQPTCSEFGYTEYTCYCGDRYFNNYLSKLEHTYDNVCDTTCDCGYVRTISHNHQPTFDATNHFDKCTICGNTINIQVHMFHDNCDTTCDCGYTRTITHNHQPTFDTNNHFAKCIVCGDVINSEAHKFNNNCDTTCDCGYVRMVPNHIYDNACDKDCNICSHTRTVPVHVYTNDCDTNCNVCNIVRTIEHKYDNSCDISCNVCGATRTTSHKFGEYVYNNNATETADGTKTRTCSICGHKETITAEGTKLEKTLIDSSKVFKDIPAKKWYKKFVDYSVTYGIFTGTSADMFSPEQDMTRAQFVQVFANISGVDTSNRNVNSGFSDVPKGKWYTAAVTWAAQNGIVNGVGGGKFDPNAKVTREQMCVMIVNYIEKYQGKLLKATVTAPTFADDSNISKWAKTAVYKCAKAGLVNGVGNNKFDPKATATRAQGATIFTNFYKEYMK